MDLDERGVGMLEPQRLQRSHPRALVGTESAQFMSDSQPGMHLPFTQLL